MKGLKILEIVVIMMIIFVLSGNIKVFSERQDIVPDNVWDISLGDGLFLSHRRLSG